MLRANRYSVASSSTEGNEANSRGFFRYTTVNSISTDKPMFAPSRPSISWPGNGTRIAINIPANASTSARSRFFEMEPFQSDGARSVLMFGSLIESPFWVLLVETLR